MRLNRALWITAQNHADDTGRNGIFGHVGSDGTIIDDRMEPYVREADYVGENCNYNYFFEASDWIIDLLIDDGVKDRNHRTNLFEEKYTSLGVGIAEHKVYDNWVVIDYASDVIPKDPNHGDIIFKSDIDQINNPYVTREGQKEEIYQIRVSSRKKEEIPKAKWYQWLVCWIPIGKRKKKPTLRREDKH